MDLNLDELTPNVRYKLLTALVIPRPIAWITTLNEDGSVNAAPYSFFNVLGNLPPLVAFGPGDRAPGQPKDTAVNAERRGEFVVNLIDRAGADALHRTSAPFPVGASEVDELGLVTLPSVAIATPRLELARVQLECRLAQKVEIGQNRVLFGIVLHMHVPDDWLDPTNFHVRPRVFEAVGRLQGPGTYCTTSDQFELGKFPTVEAIQAEHARERGD